jgi:hypothetical protein
MKKIYPLLIALAVTLDLKPRTAIKIENEKMFEDLVNNS